MSADKNFDKVAKFLSDNMDSKEREAFFAWIEEEDHKQLLDDSTEIWEIAEEEVPDFQVDMDAAWKKMDYKVQQKKHLQEAQQTLTVVSSLRPILQVAAAVLLLLMAGLWYYDSSTSMEEIVSTQPAEKTIVELPDGSEVWLNENSILRYHKQFDDRIVYLEGEAFFKVTKKEGASFEIYAADSKTTVLGTAFNIRAYPTEKTVEVAVEEGKVLVESEKKQGSQAILTQKEYAVFTKSTQEVMKAQGRQQNAAAWQKREFDLRDVNIGEAIISIERYFNIEIEVENTNIKNCRLGSTGKIANPDLETILEIIKYTTTTTYKQSADNKYLLSGEGCE